MSGALLALTDEREVFLRVEPLRASPLQPMLVQKEGFQPLSLARWCIVECDYPESG